MSPPVLLVLGAGPKIGQSVAEVFAAKGYKIALAARSLQDGTGEDGYFRLKVDFENPDTVREVFAKVTKTLGTPAVVVYNGK
jgi:NAD(P)-dependent dehydrogenase (short-subunit alcohol dehydrogenase family)